MIGERKGSRRVGTGRNKRRLSLGGGEVPVGATDHVDVVEPDESLQVHPRGVAAADDPDP